MRHQPSTLHCNKNLPRIVSHNSKLIIMYNESHDIVNFIIIILSTELS